MGFADKMNTSVHGRSLGIQRMSTAETGGTNPASFLVGTIQALRGFATTAAETTAATIRAYGVSQLSTQSSGVHTLDPPIPGTEKILWSSGGSTVYVKTANGESLESSRGSSFNTMKFQQIGWVKLVAATTARWLVSGGIDSTAVCALTTST